MGVFAGSAVDIDDATATDGGGNEVVCVPVSLRDGTAWCESTSACTGAADDVNAVLEEAGDDEDDDGDATAAEATAEALATATPRFWRGGVPPPPLVDKGGSPGHRRGETTVFTARDAGGVNGDGVTGGCTGDCGGTSLDVGSGASTVIAATDAATGDVAATAVAATVAAASTSAVAGSTASSSALARWAGTVTAPATAGLTSPAPP